MIYYQDSFVTLYLGDCREYTAWLDCDVLVTDPPYGITWMKGSMDSSRVNRVASQKRRIDDGADIANDEDTAIRDEVLAMWGKDKPAVIFGTWRKTRPLNVQHRLIWHKLGRYPGVAPSAWYPNEEEIYLMGKGWTGKPTPTVITTSEHRSLHVKNIGHSTPKPVGLMETIINKCAVGTVADPFAGSGATLLAARNSGRQSIGVELEEKYCEIIARRLSQDVLL